MDQLNNTTFTPVRPRGSHLKLEDRCLIEVMHKKGYSLREIAKEVHCSHSTVFNELKRGTPLRNGNRGRHPEYKAHRGQLQYDINRKMSHKPHKLYQHKDFRNFVVKQVMEHNWSFDACVGYAKRHNLFSKEDMVCTKTLYNELRSGCMSFLLFKLPEAVGRGKKRLKCRQNKRLFGKSIEERPKEVSERLTYGHWEIDTVIGKRSGKNAVILTLLEKKSCYYMAIKIPDKTSKSVMIALENLVKLYGEKDFSKVFKSITADNGTEFEALCRLSKLGTETFFAHPYSSWERGQNERHNRILRRYIPKGRSIDGYSSDEIMWFADEINDIPRRHLNYDTPSSIFEAFLDQVYADIKAECI